MTRSRAVTIERIESALDRLAGFIVKIDNGHELLPIYGRLEKHLAQMRTQENAMESVMDRVARSQDQTAVQSLAARRDARP